MGIFKKPEKWKRGKPHHNRPHISYPKGHKVELPTPEERRKARAARRRAQRKLWRRLAEIHKTGRVATSARQARRKRKAAKRNA